MSLSNTEKLPKGSTYPAPDEYLPTKKASLITGNNTNTILFTESPDNGKILSADDTKDGGLAWIDNSANSSDPKIWTFYHSGTAVVPSVSGGWSTRPITDINANNFDTTTITLASNQLTINVIGKYSIKYNQIMYDSGVIQLRIFNISTTNFIAGSTNSAFNVGSSTLATDTIINVTVIPTILEFQYNCGTSFSYGLGVANLSLPGEEAVSIFATFNLMLIA